MRYNYDLPKEVELADQAIQHECGQMGSVLVTLQDYAFHINFEHVSDVGEDHAPLLPHDPRVHQSLVDELGELAKFAGDHEQ